MKLNSVKTRKNGTKIIKLWRNVYTKPFFKMFTKHLWQMYLWIDLFLFKVVCLIEVSPKFMQEQTTKYIFSKYDVLVVHVIYDQWNPFFFFQAFTIIMFS